MIYLQKRYQFIDESEQKLVKKVADERGLSALYTKFPDISDASLIVGDIPYVAGALAQAGKKLPNTPSYPYSLEHLLHRKIEMMTLYQARQLIATSQKRFIKPVEMKEFTGLVLDDADDYRIRGLDNTMLVHVSEVVEWLSEWRVYVLDGQVRDIILYEGDSRFYPESSIVQSAVGILTGNPKNPENPVSYAIDFGVLSDGTTALVEMNDGFSIGAYEGVDPGTYFDILQSRWDQLRIHL